MNVHWQIGLSLGATFNRGRAPKCPRSYKAVVGSNVQKRKGYQNVQGRIRLLLGATFNRGEGTYVSMGGRRCHCRQPSTEGHECPLADRAVTGSSVQRRGRHLSVRATFKGRAWAVT
jgi:hypothetical protein